MDSQGQGNNDRTTIAPRFRLQHDARRQQVYRGRWPLQLAPQEYKLFRVLIDNPARLMANNELLEQAWGEEFVGAHGVLRRSISRLRRAIGPGADRLIRTVHRRGYRFEPDAVPPRGRRRSRKTDKPRRRKRRGHRTVNKPGDS